MKSKLPYPVPLSNFDIMAMMGHEPGFAGVRMRDELTAEDMDGSLIINLDDSSHPGTHWVGLWRNKAGQSFYFDSFGLPPPEEVLNICGRLFYSDNRIQEDTSAMCGYYAMVFIHQMNGGKTFYDFVYQFDSPPSTHNEQMIHRMASRYFKR